MGNTQTAYIVLCTPLGYAVLSDGSVWAHKGRVSFVGDEAYNQSINIYMCVE